jgi:hypothetical protein
MDSHELRATGKPGLRLRRRPAMRGRARFGAARPKETVPAAEPGTGNGK